MRKIQYPPVYAGTFFLLLIAVLSVVNSGAMIGEIFFNIFFYPLLFGAGLAAGASYRKSESVAIKTIGTIVIVSAFPVFFVMDYFHGFERAAIVLLIWLQAGRNFTLHTRRDLVYAYVVSLILILYGASISKETFFLVYIVAYALAGVFTLTADHIDDRLQTAMGGDRDLLVRGMNLPSKGIGLAALTLSLAMVIYLLFPRLPSPHLQGLPFGKGWYYENEEWDNHAPRLRDSDRQKQGLTRLRDKHQTARYDSSPGKTEDRNSGQGNPLMKTAEYPGFRRSFDISERRKTISRALMFYLQSDRPLYIRGKVFDEFDGRIWHEAPDDGKLVSSERSEFVLRKGYRGETVGQVYTIERKMPPLILSAYEPLTVRFPSRFIKKTRGLSLYAPGYLRKGTSYSVLSGADNVEGRPICPGEGYKGGDLQVPDILSERVRRLAATVTEGKGDDFQKAEAVEEFLKYNYHPTMETVFMKRPHDLVDHFLFGLREGHCEYFASAMVMMLRSVGIPSRLVTGYLAFRKNPFTGYYEVRASDAHAWVEAYSKGHGWVMFDPTPKIRLPKQDHDLFTTTSYVRYLQDEIDTALKSGRSGWWKAVLHVINQFLLKAKFIFSALVAAVIFSVRWVFAVGWIFMVPGTVLVIIFLLLRRRLFTLFRETRLRMMKGKSERPFVIACYKEMVRYFAEKGFPRPAAMSHVEYRSMLCGKFEHISDEIGSITDLFERACYSLFPVSAEDAEDAYLIYRSIRKHRESPKKRGR